MADHFISFSAPMIRALLDGSKTQTRRVLKQQPFIDGMGNFCTNDNGKVTCWGQSIDGLPWTANFTKWRVKAKAGDRFWVKEDWRTFISLDAVKPRDVWSKDQDRGAGIAFEAGGSMAITKGSAAYSFGEERDDLAAFGKLRVARFMPKWASRLTLTVSNVRVQRLQDITDRDALAEGIVKHPSGLGYWVPGVEHLDKNFPWLSRPTPREMYAALWDTIHGSGEWGKNPWVTAFTFAAVNDNINNVERVAA